MKAVSTTRLLSISAVLVFVAGCPRAAQPPLADFNLPSDVTSARISNGQEIVFAEADQANDTFDFFLAQPGEALGAHQLIASVPATDFGFAAGEPLVLPRTISFSDNLNRGVVGFDSGSFLITASTSTQAQLIGAFSVTPITAFGAAVFTPTINPLGDLLAFQTAAGEIAFLNTADLLTGNGNPIILGTGVAPIFGFDGTLGFANPDFTNFFVNNLTVGTVDTFSLNGFDPLTFPTTFSMFEAGLSPFGINTLGTFVGTTPLAFG